MKYLVIILFLVCIIIFSCLGNKLYEGLVNENQVREKTYTSGAKYAKKEEQEYKNLIANQGYSSNDNLGDDIDKYGCKQSNGERWSKKKEKCVKNLNQSSIKQDHHDKDNEYYCEKGTEWDKKKNKCISKHKFKDYCGDGTKWDDYKKMCVQNNESPSNYCEEGTFFDKIKKMCIPNENNQISSSDSNIAKNQNPLDNNFNYKNNYSNSLSSELLPNDSVYNNKNDYILKTKLVPPVCPACPPVQACPTNKKCPPCPAPEPIQPCPPCARCPEPAFECKKVPNYNSTNKDFLPRPLLNDFSKFT